MYSRLSKSSDDKASVSVLVARTATRVWGLDNKSMIASKTFRRSGKTAIALTKCGLNVSEKF